MQPRFHIWDCMGPQSLYFAEVSDVTIPITSIIITHCTGMRSREWAEEVNTGSVTTKTICPWLEMCICGWLGTGMMYLCVWVAYRLHKQMLSATDCAHIQLPACCSAVPSWLPAARYWIFVNFGQATRYVAFLESLKYTQNACFVLNASRSAFEILD